MSKKAKSVEETEQARPGRPEGAATSKIVPVHERHATCRNCGSSDLKRERVINDMEHFQDAGGESTTRRKWTRAMCRKCNTWQTIITDYNP